MGNKEYNIFIAGEYGFVGKNLKNHLIKNGYNKLISAPKELDFRDQLKTDDLIRENKPDLIVVAAGKVGGIMANKKHPAQFLYDNLMIWTNIINSAAKYEVEKLIFLGSATVYPKDSDVPFKEEYLLGGKLDKNTEAYALAKISAIKLCEVLYHAKGCNFLPLTLANLYGPYDHFGEEDSHVVPSLISKIHNAKQNNLEKVTLWGTGKPTRDLLYVEDLTDAVIYVIEKINAMMIFDQDIAHLNIGSGIEVTILEVAEKIKRQLSYKGSILFDSTKPDGTMRKYLDTKRINILGWKSKTHLEDGIKKTVEYYLSTVNKN